MGKIDIGSRFAGHTSRSARTRHALGLKPDHFIGAGQQRKTNPYRFDAMASKALIQLMPTSHSM
ncbi:hypothetical protein N0B44_00075 [Roseibacterium beibuensis]|uniref:Uncharacterized protein n=1 Tax=[Roseibacterium] beibuensis TaxID=1193142 RepID=A0ABP9L354_9RHOB|nr:hypothetical protein [Roseibacterium beibuensis]MCS6621296.1 hypothetical protein [Roseibacterium beibuensis]